MFLIASGIFTFISAIFGVYRFKYVLNRMHAAALCETLGMMLLISGLSFIIGISWHAAKMILIVVFIWLASPVSSHLIARAEILTYKGIENELEVVDDECSA
ncbi:MAG: monovalent cation/H(+) antiporter subunit G [Firmicutes bacterium]|jgi:multicomponent Na+:H+ antiporter subunit G|nr:monovalent cation/H(+) antiporter subunit G [Bacillota bacterium]